MRVLFSRKGGEWILMAKSSRFGQIVRDVVGTDSLHVAARKTGLSANLISQMRNDHVPGPQVLAKFCQGYELSEKRRALVLEAAHELREDVNPEIFIALACDMAGLDTEARLTVLEHFRAVQGRQSQRRQAAA